MADQLAFVRRTFEILRDAFRGVASRHAGMLGAINFPVEASFEGRIVSCRVSSWK